MRQAQEPEPEPTVQVFHPNLDLEGNICLNILREDWKPVLTITSIVYGLNFLFLVRGSAYQLLCWGLWPPYASVIEYSWCAGWATRGRWQALGGFQGGKSRHSHFLSSHMLGRPQIGVCGYGYGYGWVGKAGRALTSRFSQLVDGLLSSSRHAFIRKPRCGTLQLSSTVDK